MLDQSKLSASGAHETIQELQNELKEEKAKFENELFEQHENSIKLHRQIEDDKITIAELDEHLNNHRAMIGAVQNIIFFNYKKFLIIKIPNYKLEIIVWYNKNLKFLDLINYNKSNDQDDQDFFYPLQIKRLL